MVQETKISLYNFGGKLCGKIKTSIVRGIVPEFIDEQMFLPIQVLRNISIDDS